MQQNNNYLKYLLPVLLSFFCMGFVDLVGAASNFVKDDFGLTETTAKALPAMVFFWFLLFSVPTGVLMSKIGRRKTVLLSLVITILAMVVPFISYNYTTMLVAFSLLGIGNTLMQVSLNPLMSAIVKGDKLASSLTFGQFIKAIASFSAPLLMSFCFDKFNDWRLFFLLFVAISVVTLLWLGATHIEEEKNDSKNATFTECFALLANPYVLLCFIGIMCHVGIDVGVNASAPTIFMERLGLTTTQASFATSWYFLFRTIGCLSGAYILTKVSPKSFFTLSVLCMVASMAILFFFSDKTMLYIAIALVGFGNSNVFSIIFSQALLQNPTKKNEVSGLMIMGLFGGTIFPFAMGLASDAMNGSQIGALIVLSIGVLYLLLMSTRLKANANN